MAFSVKFDDVTKYEGDAILNSLGTDGRVYGRLCESIILSANSKDIKKEVDSKINGKVGDFFITNGGELSAKNIIHLVTPFKKNDADNEQLKSAYSAVIKVAIDKGYKTLGLPFIGTDANGYSEEDAYDAVTSACAEISLLEEQEDEDIIDITVIAYLKKNPLADEWNRVVIDRKQRALNRNENFANPLMSFTDCVKLCDFEATEQDRYGEVYEDTVYSTAQEFAKMDPQEYFLPTLKYYKNPYDFIDDFIVRQDINEKVLAKGGLDRRRKCQMRKQKTLSKMDIYRLSFILGMNKTQTLEFMVVCGVSFSPISKLDMFYLSYLNGAFKRVKELYELDWLAEGILTEDEHFTY